MMNSQGILAKLLNKIQQQWKLLRKAFIDLNIDKTGQMKKSELKFILDHWGLQVPQETFNDLFRYLDEDGDGVISYKDFVLRVGSEIHPSETLYFR